MTFGTRVTVVFHDSRGIAFVMDGVITTEADGIEMVEVYIPGMGYFWKDLGDVFTQKGN